MFLLVASLEVIFFFVSLLSLDECSCSILEETGKEELLEGVGETGGL